MAGRCGREVGLAVGVAGRWAWQWVWQGGGRGSGCGREVGVAGRCGREVGVAQFSIHTDYTQWQECVCTHFLTSCHHIHDTSPSQSHLCTQQGKSLECPLLLWTSTESHFCTVDQTSTLEKRNPPPLDSHPLKIPLHRWQSCKHSTASVCCSVDSPVKVAMPE